MFPDFPERMGFLACWGVGTALMVREHVPSIFSFGIFARRCILLITLSYGHMNQLWCDGCQITRKQIQRMALHGEDSSYF